MTDRPRTVRELVHEMQVEIRDAEDLMPSRAAQMLLQLTALLGNIADEIREADLDYAQKLLECYQTEGKANRARMLAEVTPEYRRKREASDVHHLAIELVRSLKEFLKVKTEEMRMAR